MKEDSKKGLRRTKWADKKRLQDIEQLDNYMIYQKSQFSHFSILFQIVKCPPLVTVSKTQY